MTTEWIYRLVILELIGALLWQAVLVIAMRISLKGPPVRPIVSYLAAISFALIWPFVLLVWAGTQIRAFLLAIASVYGGKGK